MWNYVYKLPKNTLGQIVNLKWDPSDWWSVPATSILVMFWPVFNSALSSLTHWGHMTYICIRHKGHLCSNNNGMTAVRRHSSILNHRWDVDEGILDILAETWNKIKQFYWIYTSEYVMYKTMSIFTRHRCVRKHPFVSIFFLWIMIVRKVPGTILWLVAIMTAA